MRLLLRFNLTYFILLVLLFITEVLIALYVHDDFVRPYAGDFLVVIMVYALVKSFLSIGVEKVALSVLIFAYLIEWSQYLQLVHFLGFEQCKVARIVMGSLFSWADMLAYTLGVVLIICLEKIRLNKFKL